MRIKISNTLTRSIMLGGMIVISAACSKDNEQENENMRHCPHFIMNYQDTPSQDQIEIRGYNTAGNYRQVTFGMHTNVDHETYISSAGVFPGQQPNQPEKFDSLAKAHNDLNYNRKTNDFMAVSLYRRTESIQVVSDAAYDAAHPAGTPLDDIVRISFFSAEEHMTSGYTSFTEYLGKTTSAPVYPEGYVAFYSVSKTYISESLAEFNRIKRKLIEFAFNFQMTQAPDQTNTHRFTVTYTNEDGVVLTGTTEPITIQR